MDLSQLTIKAIREGLGHKKFSALEVTEQFLEEIEKKDKSVKAFLYIAKEKALEQAKAVDQKISQGQKLSRLAGVPIALKDNILLEGVPCTAASKILGNYIASYDASVVKKLKAAGAVILGKTNLDEFAMGSSTENSAFGPTFNPYDQKRVSGGSSGGSAAAVASDMTLGALGSETGGSIRLPSAFCGVVGLKPTYGAVSRYGLMAMASSLDQIGPIAKTVEDVQEIFDIIKGKDPLDSTSAGYDNDYDDGNDYNSQSSKFKVNSLRIGVPKEYFIKGMNPGIEKIIQETSLYYEKNGHKIEQISLPHTEYALPVYYIVMSCEVSANLARYDGIRYGRSALISGQEAVVNLWDGYFRSRGEFLGPEVKRRIMLGTFALSSGYYEAYYLRAQKVRTRIKEDFDRAFQKVDLILTPMTPDTAFKIGERTSDPVQMYLSDIFTVSVNLAALPAISVPAGQVEGLPAAFQLIAPVFKEDRLFFAAKKYTNAHPIANSGNRPA